MNSKKPERLAGQFHAIVHGVDQAVAWMEENRVTSPRLHMEADRLKLKLRRQRYKSHQLGITASQNPAIGLYGKAQSGKAHLLNAMVAAENGRLETLLGNHVLDYLSHINPGDQACGV